MLRDVRRFAVFQLFLAWQGGFFFYAAVVVPTGTELLGNAVEQGRITQAVTPWLNLLGGLWHAAMAWDALAEPKPRKLRLGLLLLSFLGWVALLVLHPQLAAKIGEAGIAKADRPGFLGAHAAYLWISTGHWLLSLVQAWVCLRVWGGKPGMKNSLGKD